MSLSKEQKAFIIKELNNQMSVIKLNCDGFEVSLSLERVQNFKLAIGLYVNGFMKGSWIIRPDDYHESKFLPIRTKSKYSPKIKQQIIKIWGKRRAYKEYPDLDEKIEYKGSHFSSARSALNHLNKVSESIELLTEVAA